MKAKIDAIIWDLDGVIIDSLSLRLAGLRNAASQAGSILPDEKDLRRWLCHGPRLALTNIPGAKTSLGTFESYCRRVAHDYIQGFKGINDCLLNLQEMGVRQGLVTSRTRADTESWMDMCHVPDPFQVRITYSDRFPSKPNPGGLLAAARRLGIDPKEAAYVGDTTIDGIAASRAEMAFLLAAWGTPDADEVLSKVEAVYVPQKPLDVLGWVRGERR